MKFIAQKSAELNRILPKLKEQQDAVARIELAHQTALQSLKSFPVDSGSNEAAQLRQQVTETSAALRTGAEIVRETQSQVNALRYWIDAPESLNSARQEVKTLLAKEAALAEKQERITARLAETEAGLKAADAAAERNMQEVAKRLVETDADVNDLAAIKPVGFDIPALQFLKSSLQSMADELAADQVNLREEIEKARRHVKNILKVIAEIDYEDALLQIRTTLARTQAARILAGDALGSARMKITLDFAESDLAKHLNELAELSQ